MIPSNMDKFYINGRWVEPHSTARMGVENPATEEIVAQVALGDAVDIDAAIAAARAAFEGWTGKRPAVQRVEYLATGRGETRGMLAESGQADLVFTHDAVAIERLKRNPRLQFHTLPIPRTLYLKVNAAHPLLKDIKVRQAISLAIDRPGIAQAILREPKAAATQLFSPGMAEWHVPGLQPLVRDPGRARQLLQEAGWVAGADGLLRKDGRPFKLTLRTFQTAPSSRPWPLPFRRNCGRSGWTWR